jgi:hypothetical protein
VALLVLLFASLADLLDALAEGLPLAVVDTTLGSNRH